MRYVALCRCGAVKVQLQGEFFGETKMAMEKWLMVVVKGGSKIACGCKEAQVQEHPNQTQETPKGPAPSADLLGGVLRDAANTHPKPLPEDKE